VRVVAVALSSPLLFRLTDRPIREIDAIFRAQ
jgi:hypothetical protein